MEDKNARIHVVDALRGFSILGILLIHCLERFNIYIPRPEGDSMLLHFTDIIFDTFIMSLFAGKSYAIFAFLFGLSFFIQDDNQRKKRNDFRGRFLWRLVLLFGWGCLNSVFYTGDVLVLFSFVGVILVLTSRLSDRVVLGIAIFLFLQPVQWVKIIYSLFHPDYVADMSVPEPNYRELAQVAMLEGNFTDMIKGAWNSQMYSFTWWVMSCRIFQVGALFLMGMLIGRRKLFADTADNIRFWVRTLIIGICCYLPLNGLFAIIKELVENPTLVREIDILGICYTSFAFLCFLVSVFVLVYYKTSFGKVLSKLEPYGKMSLTMYITQSILGGYVFYNWGLGLNTLSATECIGVGVLIFIIQYTFAYWWLRSHRHGPLEYVWKKATWITLSKKN